MRDALNLLVTPAYNSLLAPNSPDLGRSEQRRRVLDFVAKCGTNGATLDEACVALGTTPNQISGRFTELRKLGYIVRTGSRKTRSGNAAAVYIA